MELKSQHSQNVNKKFFIFCYLQQGSKPLTFEWFKDGRLLSSSRYLIDTSDDVSGLTIERVNTADAGNYSCSVRNRLGSDSQHTFLLVKGLRVFFGI